MSNMLYNGVPVEQVNFEAEFEKELNQLQQSILELQNKKNKNKKFNYHFWCLKLARVNKALELGEVTLDGN